MVHLPFSDWALVVWPLLVDLVKGRDILSPPEDVGVAVVAALQEALDLLLLLSFDDLL